jgi:hypothetical protein
MKDSLKMLQKMHVLVFGYSAVTLTESSRIYADTAETRPYFFA